MRAHLWLAAVVVLSANGCARHHDAARPDLGIDSGIAHEIDSIWALDNHAHPVLSPPAAAIARAADVVSSW